MLSVHPEISMAQDPFLPLFKSFRNAVIESAGNPSLTGVRDPGYPLDEYYYFEDRLSVMRRVQSADLNLDFPAGRMPQLLDDLSTRMKLSAPLLAPHLKKLSGSTYKSIFESALEIVRTGKDAAAADWVGFNDNWTAEFFPALARAFPEARFIIVVRDVRSSIASQSRLQDGRVALTMSFARCWRKNIAFALHLQQMELFRDRLHLVTYEQIVRTPQETINELCDFLEVDYLPEMLDTTRFVGPDGTTWRPNSNFENVPQQGIYQDSLERWKAELAPEVIQLVEFIAGPDLKMAGYPSDTFGVSDDYGLGVYNQLVKDHDNCQGWRTDNHNTEIDFALELLRRYCLRQETQDKDLIERCFLFPEAYTALSKSQSLFSDDR